MRAADVLIETLQTLGATHLFSLSGNQIMPIYDAWIDSELRLIHTRHEAAAVHMADAWGRVTGRPGIALLTAGPGHANVMSAMYVALMAESPVVIISGHAPRSMAGQGPFQEIDQVALAAPVTKAAWKIEDAADMAHEIARAYQLALDGRPGPVHVSIPFDLLQTEVRLDGSHFEMATEITKQENVDHILGALQEAERPLILVGPGLMRSGVYRWARPFLDQAGIPLVGMESPRGVNDPSLGLFNQILAEADLLVLLAKKLDFTLKQGDAAFVNPKARIIQIDPDEDVLAISRRNMNDRLEQLDARKGDAKQALGNITYRSKSEGDQQWLNQVRTAIAYRPAEWQTLSPGDHSMHPTAVGRAINQFLAESEEGILIADGGEFNQWMQACVTSDKVRVINGPSGAIGSAIPFAVAVRLAYPDARIVACTGDGAFGFHPFEVDTAVRYGIPFIGVIGNDANWNAEHQIQRRTFGEDRVKGCDLLPTNYHEVAIALGAYGEHANDEDALLHALHAAEGSNLPAIINATISSHAAPKLG